MGKSSSLKKAVSVVLNVIFYLFIILILVVSVTVMNRKNPNQISSVFGRGIVPILSDSMAGNETDSFNKGDLLIVNVLDAEEKAELEVGDVVVFYSVQYDALIAHRVVEVDHQVGYVITRGDKAELDSIANGTPIEDYNDEPSSLLNVQGLCVSIIPNVGGVITYLQTTTGFGLIIVLPTILFLAYALIKFIRDLLRSKESKLVKKNEEEKELLRKQLLEEIKKEQEQKK